MIKKLFIYGTLGPDRPNEHIMRNIGGTWEKASVIGILRQEGWGSAMGYPGITLDKEGDKVEGFLFSSDKISKHWPELDEFEGEAYERVLTTVKLQNETVVDAYIYTLKRTKHR
ncbi:MAG: gamma-glutamylcyclotransferase [Desulfuromusa sp.]|nr:gamma-glutamylcyclotransferase [Desulfuromusa sp.]